MKFRHGFVDRALLILEKFHDPELAHVEKLIELFPGNGALFARSLDFDKAFPAMTRLISAWAQASST